ncbi:MAG: hypothetical protein ABUJ92_10580, partial [Desulfobacterales bacterium]
MFNPKKWTSLIAIFGTSLFANFSTLLLPAYTNEVLTELLIESGGYCRLLSSKVRPVGSLGPY